MSASFYTGITTVTQHRQQARNPPPPFKDIDVDGHDHHDNGAPDDEPSNLPTRPEAVHIMDGPPPDRAPLYESAGPPPPQYEDVEAQRRPLRLPVQVQRPASLPRESRRRRPGMMCTVLLLLVVFAIVVALAVTNRQNRWSRN